MALVTVVRLPPRAQGGGAGFNGVSVVPTPGQGNYGDLQLGGNVGTASAGGASVTAVADGSSPLCQASTASGAGAVKGGNGGTIFPKCGGACTTSYGGGGGGGGYHGGSGGCGGGGGAGSSYYGGTGVSGAYEQQNTTSLNGYVNITW